MNILVDSCSYNCQNAGDLAMLTVAVSRLRELWPGASIKVITNAPERIARHCGDVQTVPVRGRQLLLQDRLLGPVRRWLPGAVAGRWDRFEKRLVLRCPRLFAGSLGMKAVLRGRDAADAGVFLDAIDEADLVVVNGAGIMTDAFLDSALGILATLELAVRRRIPTAIFGQGFGPITNRELWRRASEVLPFVTLICARESQTSVPLLSALGVHPASVLVTGDDAVEMSFAARPRRLVSGRDDVVKIGVNVRIAPYADIEPALLPVVRDALARAARVHHALMVPIPIAHHGGRMDVETLRELLAGLGDGDGGAALDTPQRVIERVGECRLVVTGSYHGAVFALSQGIPVVALVKSKYYFNKMAGLAHEFEVGCQILRLDEDDVAGRLGIAIDRAWADAECVRLPLLERAADQIVRGRRAYARLRDLIQDVETPRDRGIFSSRSAASY